MRKDHLSKSERKAEKQRRNGRKIARGRVFTDNKQKQKRTF